MSKEEQNKAVVGRWFTEFWGKDVNLGVIDEIAAPDMLLKYSLHDPRRGRDDIKAFMTDFRVAFPDLNFWGTADLIAEGDYVVGQWEGGGTHTGPAFNDARSGVPTAAEAHQALTACIANAARIARHGVPRVEVLRPVPSYPIGFRDVATETDCCATPRRPPAASRQNATSFP